MGSEAPEAPGAPGGVPEHIGHYRLASRLGAGGMGVVYLAYSPSGRKVAVKVVHVRHAADLEFRARFRQEVAAARRVSGAFTAPVLDADPDAERPWMATQHIAGPTLSEHVKASGPLRAAELRRLAAGLAEALRDIHRAGVVHRDLKPSNVLLAADGPKVIDFGISRPSDSVLNTETGKLIGTPPFMAPEQFQRPRQVGPAADVFALGSVLVHAAKGRGPFDSDSPYIVAYQVVHDEPDLCDVPDELAPLIRSCLAKEPERRPTADALMAMVRSPVLLPGIPGQREPGSMKTLAGGGTRGAETVYAPALLDGPEPLDGPELLDGSALLDGPELLWGPEPLDAPESPTGPEPLGGPGSPAPGESSAPPDAHDGPRPRRSRPWWIGVAAATLLAVVAGGAVAVVRDQPRHARTASPETAESGVRAWEAAVPGAHGASPTSVRTASCAYSDGALYCVDRGVKAARLNAADGSTVWTREGAVDETEEQPVISGGLVQVAAGHGKRLEALDPRTGRTRWTKDVSGYGGYRFSAGDVTLLVAPDGTVTALDGRTGKALWARHIPGHARPVFDFVDGVAYAQTSTSDGGHTLITAVSPATGKTRWTHRFGGGWLDVAGGTPGGGVAVVRNDLGGAAVAVVRYDPASGRESRTNLPYRIPSPRLAAADGTVYLLSDTGALIAAGTHGVLWQLETSVSDPSPPIVAGGRMYVGAPDGRLLAIDLRGGALLGQTPPRLEAGRRGYLGSQTAPVVVGRRVFAYTPNGTVFCVDVRTLVSRAG
jgi:outer membrane protein assembly factor BamB